MQPFFALCSVCLLIGLGGAVYGIERLAPRLWPDPLALAVLIISVLMVAFGLAGLMAPFY